MRRATCPHAAVMVRRLSGGGRGEPASTEGYKGRGRTGGVEPRPYGSATRGAMGGRPQGSPLRKRYKGGRGERNPPVTASPCQPPLGKGAGGCGLSRVLCAPAMAGFFMRREMKNAPLGRGVGFLMFFSCRCGDATPAPDPDRISASYFPLPGRRSGGTGHSISQR